MSNQDALKSFLADHPRMIGALFMILLLTASAGTAAAGVATGTGGP
ncbi:MULTISPECIES: hypothetical protein [Halostella]|nr:MULTISPECIES: hypothetical protein [Halostella]